MKSYALAIIATMLLAAGYAYQNPGEITVRFLMFERYFPQGVWEMILFGAGAILMWFFSLLAALEGRGKYKRQIRERDQKIASLEAERTSLLGAIAARREHEAPAFDAAPNREMPSEPQRSEALYASGDGSEGKPDLT